MQVGCWKLNDLLNVHILDLRNFDRPSSVVFLRSTNYGQLTIHIFIEVKCIYDIYIYLYHAGKLIGKIIKNGENIFHC